MLEILVVRHRNQSIEVFSRQLVPEADLRIAESGELGHESAEPDAAIDGEDLGVAADVG